MKVSVDYIPNIVDLTVGDPDIQALLDRLNIVITRLNEILRLQAVAINTIEFLRDTDAENVYCDHINVTFGASGTELVCAHGLQKIPSAIVGTKLDRAGDVYFSSAATSANIYLKSNVDNLSGSIIII